MEMTVSGNMSHFTYQNQRRGEGDLYANGFKRSEPLSMDASTRNIQASDSMPANPYNSDEISDEAWQTFVKATQGFDPMAADATQKQLFEDREFVNTMSSALSLLDWGKRAEVLKNNIVLPQSGASEIPDAQKRFIAHQMEMMVDAQVKILDNFGFLAQNGGAVSIDLVA